MSQTKIKICGLRRPEDIEYANVCRPDFIGFVFAQSRRRITLEQARNLKKNLHEGILSVGVFVDAPLSVIRQAVEEEIIDMVQLHGKESLEYMLELRRLADVPLIKSISVENAASMAEAGKLPCEYLLLDNGPGGTGETFSWEVLKEAKSRGFQREFFLAGGINEKNIAQALEYGPYCVDVSSGAETDGYKDFEKMKKLAEAVRKD